MLEETYSPSSQKENLAHTLRDTHERLLDYRDLLQVPTAVSLTGLGLVARGCKNITSVAGVNYIAAGRGCDLLDGTIARALGQESDTGALADATCDKLGLLMIAGSALRQNAVPKYALGSMFASNLTSAGLTAAAAWRHPRESYRPTRAGKYSMAAFTIGILSYLYETAFSREYPELKLHPQFQKLGHTATAAGIALAIPTNSEYAARL